jgi:hypothetical protein
MVKILFFQIHWNKENSNDIKVKAAIHSYVAIASPILKPLPLIPINCSALILLAINDAPMAPSQGTPAKKNNLTTVSFFFFYKSTFHILQSG